VEPPRSLIRWRGGAEEARGEPLPLLPPGFVLLRVRYALWSGVEEAAREGLLAPDYGVVMGFSGAGTPLEAAGEARPPPARLLAPARLGEEWLPGLLHDGWLAEYTVAPLWALEEARGEEWLAALSLPASLACEALSLLDRHGASSLLVAGGGVFGYLLAAAAAEEGYPVALWTRKRLRCPKGCVAQESPPSGGYDAAVVSSASAAVAWEAVARSGAGLVAVHPAATSPAPSLPGRRLTATVLRGGEPGCWRSLLRRQGWLLEKRVERIRGLTVPGGLGDLLGVVMSL
jgi:hypothetical protein